MLLSVPEEKPKGGGWMTGVWEAADAPDGYIALVVYGSGGRRLLRLEVAIDVYSAAWVGWLERWLRRWDKGALRIVR